MERKNEYTPRPGSHVHAAMELMLEGPATTAQLGAVMKCPANNVSSRLYQALTAGRVLRLQDKEGTSHYARTDTPYDPEKFQPPVEQAAAGPNPADPFGLVARRTGAPTQRRAPPAAARSTDLPPVPSDFVAALFSNNELLIQANGGQVRLHPCQLDELRTYLSRFDKEPA